MPLWLVFALGALVGVFLYFVWERWIYPLFHKAEAVGKRVISDIKKDF